MKHNKINWKRRLCAMMLVLALLCMFSGCAGDSTDTPSDAGQSDVSGTQNDQSTTPSTPDSAQTLFTAQTMPRIDGSTANIPMAILMLQRLLGVSENEADAMLNFSTTPYAYEALVEKKTDLLLVYEADEETKALIRESGVELEYHAIGRDALVFLANEGNTVNSLTTKQLQDIYQGKITNWKTLGGADKKIEAYQRPVKSGSQALMVKLVMKDLPLMEAPVDYYPSEMGGLIDALGSYKNEQNALGYSVYYYVKNMYNLPGLKLMAIDGVAPSEKTIADGSYPFINEFYAVIRASEPENSNTRKLLNWVLSSEGKQAIEDAGYVGL